MPDRTRLTDLPFFFLLGFIRNGESLQRTIIFPSLILLFLYAYQIRVYPDTAVSPATDTISTIIISGNNVTKTETVNYISRIYVGMKYDSIEIKKAKKRLKNTGLFFKVDVFSLHVENGYRIYIVLTEKFYLLPYDLGGELYSYRYGKKKQWWRLRVGMEYTNFRGKAEILRTSLSIWDWHSIGLGWSKPFLPSPWFFGIGASAHQFPDEVFRIDHSILRGAFTFGRNLPLNSKVQLSVMPLYRRRIMYDTGLVVNDTVKVYEAFSLLRWRTDFRESRFDPESGWMLAMDVRTNSLYNGIAPKYLQLYSDFRWYTAGLFPNHKVALRGTSIMRNNDAGVTHRLQLGGEGSIRGYARSQFGLRFIANNSFTLSAEYRFPLYHFPDMDLYPLSVVSPVFSRISYRIDGALIMDYGRVSPFFKDLFSVHPDQSESGIGIGAGLRAVTPTFERSVCFDLVWGTDPWAPRGYLRFKPQPAWHFYLDMYF